MTADDDLGPLWTDIHRGRHWDHTGREYRLIETGGEISYEPIDTPAADELAPPPRPRAPIVFLDVETTGLGEDDEIWELAAIYRHESAGDTSEVTVDVPLYAHRPVDPLPAHWIHAGLADDQAAAPRLVETVAVAGGRL